MAIARSKPSKTKSAARRRKRMGRPPQVLSEDAQQFKSDVIARLTAILDQAKVPEHGRASFLAGLTSRNRQTVTAWLRGQNLPDLAAFASMAVAFDFDVYHLLGITKTARRHLPRTVAGLLKPKPGASEVLTLEPLLDDERISWFVQAYGSDPSTLVLRPMVGDAMAPDIQHNELIAIDARATAFQGDGIYALEKDKTLFVRRVEVHLNGGYTLHAKNPAYSEVRINAAGDGSLRDISILGRVAFVLKTAA